MEFLLFIHNLLFFHENELGTRILPRNVGKWFIDMEFGTVSIKSCPNHELRSEERRGGKFDLLYKVWCFIMKMSWELESCQEMLENGLLTWNLERFPLKVVQSMC